MKYASKLSGHPVAPESIPLAHPLLRAPGFNLTVIYASQRLSITLIRITCRYLELIRFILSARLLFPVSQARHAADRGLLSCPIAFVPVAALQSRLRFLSRECIRILRTSKRKNAQREDKCARASDLFAARRNTLCILFVSRYCERLHYGHIAVGVTRVLPRECKARFAHSCGSLRATLSLPALRFRS